MAEQTNRRRRIGALVGALAITGTVVPIALAASPAQALVVPGPPLACGEGVVTWTGGHDGVSWSDPFNWDTDEVPQAFDQVVIPAHDPAFSVEVDGPEVACSLTLGDGRGDETEPSLTLGSPNGALTVAPELLLLELARPRTSAISAAPGQILDYGSISMGDSTHLSATDVEISNGQIGLAPSAQISAPLVTLDSGGLLQGWGTVTGLVDNPAGLVEVADSTLGPLTINGDYTQGSAGSFESHINSTEADGNFGQLKVTGTAALDGEVFTDAGSIAFPPTAGDLYPLIDAGNKVSGQFATLLGQTYTYQSTTYTFLPQYSPGEAEVQLVGPPPVSVGTGGFTPAPTITDVSPKSGDTVGGTTVTISGTGFVPGSTSFFFGAGNPAIAVSCPTATSCTAVTRAGSGTVDITATVFGGVSSEVNAPADRFSFVSVGGAPPAPELLACAAGNPRFVCQAFLDLLGRVPDPAGLGAWTAALNGQTRTQLVLGIESSSERLRDLVGTWFQTYLARSASPSETAAWASLLTQGLPHEAVESAIIGSPEYFTARGGSTTAGFLAALYSDVLGRPIDGAGQALWSTAMAHGASRSQVALAVLSSVEGRTAAVGRWYEQFLRRAATPGDLAGWVGAMGSGVTDDLVIGSLIGSPEYFARFAS